MGLINKKDKYRKFKCKQCGTYNKYYGSYVFSEPLEELDVQLFNEDIKECICCGAKYWVISWCR